MSTQFKRIALLYWLVTLAALAGAIVMLFVYTPVEATMGRIQKIFYVHLPSAINAFLACLVAFVGGIGYLWHRQMKWDALSAAAAKVAALMCTVVLLTGMVWGRYAWGAWWIWTPRMTFSLLLWLLYVVYLVIRPSIESRQTRATVCAVYAVAAFLDVPLVYLSARLIPDAFHPPSIALAPEMKLTLAVWFVPVTLLTIGLITAIYLRDRRRSEREQASAADVPWEVPGPVAGPAEAEDPTPPQES